MEKKPRLKKSGYLVMKKAPEAPQMTITLWAVSFGTKDMREERTPLVSRTAALRALKSAKEKYPENEYFLVHAKVVG